MIKTGCPHIQAELQNILQVVQTLPTGAVAGSIAVLTWGRRAIKTHCPWCWIECRKIGIEPIKAAFGALPYTSYQMNDLNLLCAPKDRLETCGLAIQAPQV